MPVELDERWIELDYGELDGRSPSTVSEEVWQRWRADASFAPAGWRVAGGPGQPGPGRVRGCLRSRCRQHGRRRHPREPDQGERRRVGARRSRRHRMADVRRGRRRDSHRHRTPGTRRAVVQPRGPAEEA